MFINSRIDKLIELKQNSISGITIQQMSDEMGLPISTLNNIKSGLSKPSVDKLEAIALYFNVDMNYFFDIKPLEKPKNSEEVKVLDGNEYLLKRFEELVAENTTLKARLEAYEKQDLTSYSLQNVPNLKAAEPSTKLKK